MSLMGSFVLLTLYLKGIGNKGINIWVKNFFFDSDFLLLDLIFLYLQSLPLWLLIMLIDFLVRLEVLIKFYTFHSLQLCCLVLVFT